MIHVKHLTGPVFEHSIVRFEPCSQIKQLWLVINQGEEEEVLLYKKILAYNKLFVSKCI